MKRVNRVLLALSIVALAAAPAALAGATPPVAHAATTPTVKSAHTSLGKILVTGSGSTLFMFTRDHHNTDACVRINGCSAVWPVLKANGKLSAGGGLASSRLSTIRLRNGTRQVTYDGHPLYTYSFSSGPRDTSYVGARQFGGSWYALSVAGHAVK